MTLKGEILEVVDKAIQARVETKDGEQIVYPTHSLKMTIVQNTLSAIKERVPKEINNAPKEYIDIKYEIYGGSEYDSGFNACRNQFLNEVEG